KKVAQFGERDFLADFACALRGSGSERSRSARRSAVARAAPRPPRSPQRVAREGAGRAGDESPHRFPAKGARRTAHSRVSFKRIVLRALLKFADSGEKFP